jgi:hypothetical protein
MVTAIYASSECGKTFQASAASQTGPGYILGERSIAFIQELESEASRRTSLPNDLESFMVEPGVTGAEEHSDEDELPSFRKVHVIFDDSKGKV